MGSLAEHALRPHAASLFDMAPKFEDAVLNVLPSAVALFLSPLLLLQCLKQSVHVRNSPLLWLKLCGAIALVGVEIASLVLRCIFIGARTDSTFAAASVDLMAASTVGAVLYWEHRRSIRTSALLGLHLAIGILIDATKSRSYYMRPGLENISALASIAGSIRLGLLILEELPKDIIQPDSDADEIGREALGGFWSRTCFLWLNSTLLLGFRRMLTIDDLGSIGPEFSSRRLYMRFAGPWKAADKSSKHTLLFTCARVLGWRFAVILIPRLAVTLCSFAQPYLLERSIELIGNPHPQEGEADGMVAAIAVAFVGIAIAHATTDHMSYRCVTQLRGVLVSSIMAKTHRLPVADARRSAAVTLMTTDMDGIAAGLPKFYDLPIGLLEVVLGVYFLSRYTGRCWLIVVAVVALSSFVSYSLGRRSADAYKSWSKRIELRVAETATMLAQLQVVKMLGLGPVMTTHLQCLRLEEIQSSRPYRVLRACLSVWIEFADMVTPMVVISIRLLTIGRSPVITASGVFPVLSILDLIIRPLIFILQSYSLLQPMFASLGRIDEFLKLEEHIDQRLQSCPPLVDKEKMAQSAEAPTVTYLVTENSITFDNVSMGPKNAPIPILQGLNFGILRGSIVAVLGPTGSGKSYFLQSVLGESHISNGKLYTDDRDVAYCSQNVWLENGSLRDNVVGPRPFFPELYKDTIRACMLEKDIAALPGGDDYLVGSRGMRLSGGQRARVSIARAVYSELSTVVLDDIFSSLDRKTAVAVLSRLVGENGLLKKRKATVLLATYLPECLDVADSLVVLNGRCGAALEKNVQPGTHRYEIIQILSKPVKETAKAAEEIVEAKNIPVESEQLPGVSEADLVIRQQGDWGLYKFLINSFGSSRFTLWLFLMFGLSSGEIGPTMYLRMWISIAPTNMRYFMGYAALGVFVVLMAFLTYWVLHFKLSPRSSYVLHKKLLTSTIRATLSFSSKADCGFILNRYSQDMGLISQSLPLVLYTFLYSFIFQIMQIAVIVSGSILMIGVLAPTIAIAYAVQYGYLRTSRQLRHLDLEAKTPLYTQATETSDGLLYIRAFGWQEYKLRRGFERLDASQKPFYVLYSLQRWLGLVLDLLAAAIALILAAIALKLRGITSEAAFGLSFYHAIDFSRILTTVIRSWTHLETTVGAISRLRSFILDTPAEPERGMIPPKSWPRCGKIQLQRVTSRYSPDTAEQGALKNISLTIEPGQKIGLVGRTGSGKTSLMLSLLGFLNYTGNIRIDGLEVSAVQREELRCRITTISQEQLQLSGTVRYNLRPYDKPQPPSSSSGPGASNAAAAQLAKDDAEIQVLLERLRIWDAILARGGLRATLSAVGLSHGQMQLLCVARAVLRQRATGSRVVLVDEATASVDPATDAVVQRVMADEFAGCTVLTVAHRPETIAEADVQVEMAQGQISEVRRRKGEESDEGRATGRTDGRRAMPPGGFRLPWNIGAKREKQKTVAVVE